MNTFPKVENSEYSGSPQSATLEIASLYRGFGMSKFCSIPFQWSGWRI